MSKEELEAFKKHITRHCKYDPVAKTYTFTEEELLDYLWLTLREMKRMYGDS